MDEFSFNPLKKSAISSTVLFLDLVEMRDYPQLLLTVDIVFFFQIDYKFYHRLRCNDRDLEEMHQLLCIDGD
jgi:hypothetical protein